ncbi:MAG: hypothetical protein VXY13_06300 [Pseudomonadota bacterium]|nr:hypothetical protein [Pseudomonadota bacterium]
MRQTALLPAILAGAFILMVSVAGLATTPVLYRHLALSQSDMPAAGLTPDLPRIDLKTVSTGSLVTTSLKLILPGPPPVMLVGGFADGQSWYFDPASTSLRAELRLVFLQWLLATAVVVGLILWLVRRFLARHYSAPLTALIDTVNDFSNDPTVASPIPDALTQSPEFIAAARARLAAAQYAGRASPAGTARGYWRGGGQDQP